jgi:hypothetical protein
MNNNEDDARLLVAMDSKSPTKPAVKAGAIIAGVKLEEDEVVVVSDEGIYFNERNGVIITVTLDSKSPTLETQEQEKVGGIGGEGEYFNELIEEIWRAMSTPIKMSLLM